MTGWSTPRWQTARKTHQCWSCSRTIRPRETYSAQALFEASEPPARLATCEHCEVLYRTCPTDLRSDTRPDAYQPATEWNRDIPTGWEPCINAWRNQWQQDGQLIDADTIPRKETS